MLNLTLYHPPNPSTRKSKRCPSLGVCEPKKIVEMYTGQMHNKGITTIMKNYLTDIDFFSSVTHLVIQIITHDNFVIAKFEYRLPQKFSLHFVDNVEAQIASE